MAPLRCSTIKHTDHTRTAGDNQAQASHLKSNDPSLSPSNSLRGNFHSYSHSRLDENDFQSNAQVDLNPCPHGLGLPLTGLGIHFADTSQAWYGFGAGSLLSQNINQADGNPEHCQQNDFVQSERYFLPCSWSPLPSPRYHGSAAENYTQDVSHAAGLNVTTSHGVCLKEPDSWTLDSFAAASGMSTQALAEQLSSTADIALRYLSEGHQDSFSSFLNLDLSSEVFVNDDRRTNWPVLPPFQKGDNLVANERPALTGIESSVSVNPIDLIGEMLYDSDQSRLSFTLSSSMSLSSDNSADAAAPPAHPGQGRVKEPLDVLDNIHIDPPIIPALPDDQRHTFKALDTDSNKENSDYEQPQHESSSQRSSPFPSPRVKKRSSKKKKFKHPARRVPLFKDVVSPPTNSPTVKVEETTDINLGTPVFDAHKGISLDELKAKAERYRLRNPGLSYDNRWLVSFAGKLSHQGELIEEFRCYVAGCSQKNKRRDHILIHLGGHLDQRPYECSMCPTRFLRKNECKRHELSHSGKRPFLCDLCPPGTAFVRQDLLRRHITRTHGRRKQG